MIETLFRLPTYLQCFRASVTTMQSCTIVRYTGCHPVVTGISYLKWKFEQKIQGRNGFNEECVAFVRGKNNRVVTFVISQRNLNKIGNVIIHLALF
jgi:hypothetical protein